MVNNDNSYVYFCVKKQFTMYCIPTSVRKFKYLFTYYLRQITLLLQDMVCSWYVLLFIFIFIDLMLSCEGERIDVGVVSHWNH